MSADTPTVSTVSVAEWPNAIRAAAKTRVPHVGLGHPGLGKTQLAIQTAEALGMQYAEAVFRDIGDAYMPYVTPKSNGDAAHLTFHYASSLPIVGNPAFDDRPILFNIDEITTYNRLCQNLLLKVLDEWRIGEAKLRDDVAIIATGNRIWDKANVEQLSSALANRADIVHYESDLDFWLDWAMRSDIHPLVMAWVKFDPTNLYHFDSKAFQAGDFPFPSERSNEKLSRLCHYRDGADLSDRLFRAKACGTIGMSRGTKFAGYVRLQHEMPDTGKILASPDGARKAKIPESPAAIYATMAALIQRVDNQSLSNVCIYADRLAPEWHLLYTKNLSQAKPALVPTAAWGQWLTEHTNTLS